ncbi:MAG: L,D-transpeptidase [Deltaproteobacteria bacterium]|nr:L,D-transpeptidase [Deltaproteobacteria bacterium]
MYEVRGRGWEALARVGEGRWVRASGLRVVLPQPPPPEVNVARRERWVDVDLTTQTLVAYEGADPVYATLVSTGLEDSPTEPGIFRVWEKHTTRTMDDAPGSSPARHMRYGDVPWVQFFDGSRALHGAYWHDHFGVAVSHGCVNLAPADARWLFLWTTPEVPAGWSERTPRPSEGALVRVRGRYVE